MIATGNHENRKFAAQSTTGVGIPHSGGILSITTLNNKGIATPVCGLVRNDIYAEPAHNTGLGPPVIP